MMIGLLDWEKIDLIVVLKHSATTLLRSNSSHFQLCSEK